MSFLNEQLLYENQDLRDEIERLEQDADNLRNTITSMQLSMREQRERIAKLEAVLEAAKGLSIGFDWNKGTHAEIYRPKLIKAVAEHLDGTASREADNE